MKYIEWLGTHFIGLFQAGADQLTGMVTGIIPLLIVLLTFSNALASLIGREKVDKAMKKFAKNPILRYTLLPVLAVLLLTNPMAFTFGKYLPESQKPAFYDSAVSFVHPVTGLFPYANGAELFVYLGIANGISELGLSLGPLAVRYFLAGVIIIFIRGLFTERMTAWLVRKDGMTLAELNLSSDASLEEENEENKEIDQKQAAFEDQGLEEADTETYKALFISKGPDGWGRGLTVRPTRKAHTILSVTGGGIHPLAQTMADLSGMDVVDGFHHSIPEDEIACVVIDCGGTARIGIYPMKNILTIDVLPSNPSGPLAKYISEKNFVSGVGKEQVRLAHDKEISEDFSQENASLGKEVLEEENKEEQLIEENKGTESNSGFSSFIISFSKGIGRVMSIFYQAGRTAVSTTLKSVLPFMAFISMLVGIINYTGIGGWIAKIMQPLAGSLPGMIFLALICSLPFLSPILGPGAVIAQVVGVLVGNQIAAGVIPPAYALPALFAINAQVGCDFIPVGLSLSKSKAKTVEIGVPAILYSRVITGILAVLLAYLMSLGLYA